MRTRGSIAMALGCCFVGCGLLLSGCLRNWDDYGHDLGEPCASDDECRSGTCAVGDDGERECVLSCADGSGCLPGWTCNDDGTCSCAGGAESCNGIDDDCDGAIDEDGVCGCSAAEACNAIDDDCDGAVDEGACGSCVPRIEGCNGVDDDCDGLVDEEPSGAALCRPGFECFDGTCRCSAEIRPATDELDLLFVVDNSNSMAEEQASLVAELPRFLRALGSGDRDGDGLQDFSPARSIHIGVVTTDMGVGGFAVPTCDRGTLGTMFGDDGILTTRGRTATPGCLASYPSVFAFESGSTDPDSFTGDVSCVAMVGTGGCGFEQQLEATLKALSPSSPQAWTIPGYTPPVFFASTFGHADGRNAGLVRPSSALGIVLVTDEEDCSVANPGIFDATTSEFPGDLNLRCWMYEDQVAHPIERFVRGVDGSSGLLGLRRRPDRLVVSMITGVPVDAVPDPRTPDYDAVLAHPAMQNRLDPDAPATAPRLVPSCNVPGRGIAMPARRIVRTARELDAAGARVSLGSICQASYAGPFDALLEDVAESLTAPPACL